MKRTLTLLFILLSGLATQPGCRSCRPTYCTASRPAYCGAATEVNEMPSPPEPVSTSPVTSELGPKVGALQYRPLTDLCPPTPIADNP